MNASLPVEIVDTVPSAVYLGQVYTQHAVLALDDGSEFRVYDPNRLVAPDMLQTQRRVDLVVAFAVVAPSPVDERAIHFDREDRPVFRGRVTELPDEDGRDGVLDVGSGSVRFDPSDADDPVTVGEYLQLTRHSIQLAGVEGSREYGEEYESFLEKLSDGDLDDRTMAARYLGARGSERGLDELLDALREDEAPEVRAEVATALGRIGMAARPPGEERDPRIERALAAALEDGTESVAEAARLAIEDIRKSERDHMHSRDW